MIKQFTTYQQFVKKLGHFRTTEKKTRLLTGLFRYASWQLLLLIVLIFIEAYFDLNPPTRIIISSVTILASLFLLVFYMGPPVFSILVKKDFPTLNSVALCIGGKIDLLDDRLANALQLFQRYHDDSRYSADLVDQALKSVYDKIHDISFLPFIEKSALKSALRNFMIVTAFIILIVTLTHKNMISAADQLLHPWHDMDTQQTTFAATPGDTTIVQGSDLKLAAWISDSSQTSITLNTSNQDPIVLQKAGDDSFHYHIKAIQEGFTYYYQVNEQVSESYTVSVQDRPMLRFVQVTVTPPRYSGIETYKLDENVGDISALKGSRVLIEGKPNKELAAASIHFSSDKDLNMELDSRSVSAGFTLLNNDTYTFELQDTFGFTSSNPIQYTIRQVPDQYPVIRLLVPGQDVDLTDEMILPLVIEAQDDYGLEKISLVYQVVTDASGIDSSRFVRQELQGIDYNQDQVRIALNWDLSDSDMLPTESIAYFVQVYDNDTVSGPKRSFTPIFYARFPSMYEMYQEISQTQDDAIREMEDIYEKRQEVEEKVDNLSRELQRAKELDWERQQQAEQALKQQQEIQQKMDDLQKDLDEMVQDMEKNDLASTQTLEKYKELNDLYQEIMTPELQKMMQDMAESLSNVDKNMLQKAMNEFKMTEEDISKNLERTISLLKRLKIEQQIDQAIKMADDIAERQENLSQRQETGQKDRLAREQENIRKDKKAMSKDLEKLRKEMSELPQMPQKEMDQAQQQLDSDSLSQALDDLQKMVSQGDNQNFQKQSQHVQQKMQQISQTLQRAKEKMDGTQQQKAMMALKKNIRQLLELSKGQEDLMQQTGEIPANSSGIQAVADRQNNMLSGLKRVINAIFELSKENMMLNTGMQSALGSAELNMEQTLNLLENRNHRQAAQKQGASMMSMNQAILMMQQSMKNMMQSSGGGMSFEQFMKQMQQMAQNQQQLNQSTQQMSMDQQRSLAQQAQMAKLAAEQQGLRKSMEQLAKEASGASEILGDLDQIAKDMKQVEKDLNNQTISRETLHRQNRILSRMLDAQRSMRQREYSRQRKAETGNEYAVTSPGALPADLGERESLLQTELLQAKKQGFSQDYLNLIKEYFKALTEKAGESSVTE